MRSIWLNEDDAHFYSCHPAEDMTEAGCQRLADIRLARALVEKVAVGAAGGHTGV